MEFVAIILWLGTCVIIGIILGHFLAWADYNRDVVINFFHKMLLKYKKIWKGLR